MSESSQLFKEFIICRCQEVIEDDEECSNLDKEIAAVEANIKAQLNSDQYKIFLRYEKLITEWQAKKEILIYKQGLDDRIKRTGV